MYRECPKCRHTPLPTDQSLPAACPACGVILAKVGRASGPRERPGDPLVRDESSRWARLGHVPERIDSLGWWLRLALWAGFLAWGLALLASDVRTGEIGRSFLHGPLLVFHEAGHVLLRPFGEWLTVFGGTLAQLLMPVLALLALLRRGDAFGASFGLWLAGVSLMDVAAYVYDAQSPQLPLLGGDVGGESHDWIYLLSGFGLLQRSQALGLLVHALGAMVVLLALAWGGALLLRLRGRIDASG